MCLTGEYVKKFVSSKKRKASRNTQKRRLDFRKTKRAKKSANKVSGPDEHYGFLETDNLAIEELTPDEFSFKRTAFLLSLEKTGAERVNLERETILQGNSPLWKSERKKRLTASWFGKVCHMRKTTSCREMVHGILYSIFSNRAMMHGQVNEPVAKEKMASVHGIVASPCGLFVDDEFPFLAASPGKIFCTILCVHD